MRIGVPTEVKSDEYRVAMLPVGVEELTARGHEVLIQTGSGAGSGMSDEVYRIAGATIVETAKELFAAADMIVKVKEPQPAEYELIRPGQILFTYFHFAASEKLTAAMIAAGFQASVSILDVNLDRLRYLDDIMPANVNVLFSDRYTILEEIQRADLVVGSVLIPGAKAPQLVRAADLKLMKPGSVIIDVAVDQGGCVETTRPTTHRDPTFIVDDVVHYCVANMPGAVGRTSTYALCNATLPYVIRLANKPGADDCRELASALNIHHGEIVNQAVADAFGS